MIQRHTLNDEEWRRLESLLPKARRGPQPCELRRAVNGILWILRTGAPWRDLPTCYGPWETAASRFYRWRVAGVWETVLAQLQRRGDAAGELDWSAHCADSTVIRAHQHAAGARRTTGGPAEQALGRSQGGFSTKVHLRAERGGTPITFLVTAGQCHEHSVFEALVDHGAVKRAGRGRPRLRPKRIVGDKGYSSGYARRSLRRRKLEPVIPPKSNERRQRDFDRELYRERNRVERLINRLKQCRRVATRYEKLAVNFLAMVTIAAILTWV